MIRATAGADHATTHPIGRHPGERPGRLRAGQRPMDFAYDCRGDRGGVRTSLPPRACAEAATRFGLFRAARRRVLAAPMPRGRTVGSAALTPTLKNSPRATVRVNLHRRSQLPPGLDTACDLGPRRPSTGGPRHGRTPQREDPGGRETLALPLPLPIRAYSTPRPILLFWSNWRVVGTAAKVPS